jgi:hypothetical protein
VLQEIVVPILLSSSSVAKVGVDFRERLAAALHGAEPGDPMDADL